MRILSYDAEQSKKITEITKEIVSLYAQTIQGINVSRLHFSIMHGNGNVIIVLDEQTSSLDPVYANSGFAQSLCTLFKSIKVDGISFIRRSNARVKMTFFDRDGTAEPMCGNGLRCTTLYAHDCGYISDTDCILTDDGEKWVNIQYGTVHVALGQGREFATLADDMHFVFTGVPHLVLIRQSISEIDVKREGAHLRYNSNLCARLNHPEGIHVDYIQPCNQFIYLRTYEVGVEDETLSCGTGAAAAAFIAHKMLGYPYPVRLQTHGGSVYVGENQHGLVISGIVEYLFSQ
jgi:diaminopimelate epimerase